MDEDFDDATPPIWGQAPAAVPGSVQADTATETMVCEPEAVSVPLNDPLPAELAANVLGVVIKTEESAVMPPVEEWTPPQALPLVKLHIETVSDMPTELHKPANRIFSSMQEAAFSEILFMKLQQIQQKGQCDEALAKKLLIFASRTQVSAEPRTVTQLRAQRGSKLSLGDPLTDALLGGGISENGGIIELVGEAGSGKSQFLMQAMLQAQLPRSLGGVEGRSILITTEHWSEKRWAQLSTHYQTLHPQVFPYPGAPSKGLTRFKCQTCPELLTYLATELPQELHNPAHNPAHNTPVKLVVIDSIAALFRGQDEVLETVDVVENGQKYQMQVTKAANVQAMEQAAQLFRLAQEMKALSDLHNIVFILANQVSDYKQDYERFPSAKANESFETSNRKVIPVLGMSWSQCLNLRIQLRKSERQIPIPAHIDPSGSSPKRRKTGPESYSTDSAGTTRLRLMTLALSSQSPRTTLPFWIDNSGLHGFEDSSVV